MQYGNYKHTSITVLRQNKKQEIVTLKNDYENKREKKENDIENQQKNYTKYSKEKNCDSTY